MRKRRNVILAIAIASWLAIACGSGGGTPVGYDVDGYDTPPFTGDRATVSREVPPFNWENPGPGREIPPDDRDRPGGGGGGCPPCDSKLTCLISGQRTTITLKTVEGQCSAGKGVTFDCSGRILQQGAQIGTWSGAGDNYSITVSVKGQRGPTTTTVSCTKGATSTPSPTPTPTPTPTVAPRPGTVVSDAGTRG